DPSDFYAEANVHANTRLNLTFSLFKGVSIQFHDVNTAEEKVTALKQYASVKAAYPVRAINGPSQQKRLWEAQPSRDPFVLRRQEENKDAYSTHIMTQVDKLRAKGITGKGIKIGVIDSGIDYKHPALGGCFGKGCLVEYGTDLVGDDFDGTFKTLPKPDSDPMDCGGHGTSVAGIIAARDNPLGFTGAAPDVKLGIYKVFGCAGSATTDVLIAAFNKAYEDGSNIITASISGPAGWIDEPWSAAVSRIVDAGVPCTLGAGNSGQMGIFFGGGAAGGKGVTSVASVDNIVVPARYLQDTYTINGSDPINFHYVPSVDRTAWDNVSLPLWSPSLNKFGSENGCDPYLSNTPNLSGKIVLVRRGECDFSKKAENAASKGAKYLMIYNNAAGGINIPSITLDNGGPGVIGASLATAEVGAAWISALQAGSNVIVNMRSPSNALPILVETPNNATGGYPSNFTSWGPNFDGYSKPQFGAPGGNIVTLYLQSQGSYEINSGTSLSTPLVASILALVAQVRGTFNPSVLESLLSATAKPSRFNIGFGAYPYLAPVAQQGAGLIQAFDAAYATSIISVSSLSFNDTDNIAKQSFAIKNLNSETVTYELSNIGAATAYTFAAGGDASAFPMSFPNDLVAEYATLAFSKSSILIPAGSEATIDVIATPPDLDTARLPVWSGYVAVNGSDGSSFTIPYQGISGSLHNRTVLVDSSDSVWLTTSEAADAGTFDPVQANHTFVLPPQGTANGTNSSIAAVAVNLAFGSPLVRFWVVPVTPSIAENATEVEGGVKTIGQIALAPMRWLSRDVSAPVWDGQLQDSSYAPEGQYKVVVQALHVYGDETKIEQFDHAESPLFNIVYEKAS
ncbi:Minor extracellular protease vpr 4, partial [Colletotrichum chlorophyti]